MSEIKDPALKIGLGWLRKKGWATIEAGVLKPTGDAPRGKDEEILETLLAGPKSGKVLDEKGRYCPQEQRACEIRYIKVLDHMRYGAVDQG